MADRLFVNLLKSLLPALRAFHGNGIGRSEDRGVDESRTEQHAPQVDGAGHLPELERTLRPQHGLSPEKEIEFEATYPGWYRAIHWKPWWTRDTQRHTLDFHAALDASPGAGEPCRYGTTYAYAESRLGDRRQEVALNFG